MQAFVLHIGFNRAWTTNLPEMQGTPQILTGSLTAVAVGTNVDNVSSFPPFDATSMHQSIAGLLPWLHNLMRMSDGTYTVRLFDYQTPTYLTVDRWLPTDSSGKLAYSLSGTSIANNTIPLWPALLEKALNSSTAHRKCRTLEADWIPGRLSEQALSIAWGAI